MCWKRMTLLILRIAHVLTEMLVITHSNLRNCDSRRTVSYRGIVIFSYACKEISRPFISAPVSELFEYIKHIKDKNIISNAFTH